MSDEVEAERGPKGKARPPWGLLGMLALVLAIEAGLARREVDFTSDPWAWDWVLGGRTAGKPAVGRDLLCFGDSLVKFAVMPRVVEHRSGLKTYNLALGGGMAESSYFQLRHALEAGAKPKAILVDFWPDLFHKEPNHNPRQLSQVATPRDIVDLGLTSRDGRLFGEVLAGWFFTSIRCRYEVKDALLAAFQGRKATNRDEVLAFWRNWRANDGSMVWPRHPRFVHGVGGDVDKMPEPMNWQWREAVYPDAWRGVTPANLAYMGKFFELAREHKVPVFYLMTPLHPVVQARRERIGIDQAHTRFVREIQARFPEVTVVDARHVGYPAWVFMDFIHLDCLGSSEFSGDLAEVLKLALAGPPAPRRWVDMPAYQGHAPDVELEDLDRSRLVQKADGDLLIR